LARRVEDLGASTLTVADHLDDQFAPVPAVMAAACATTGLRVATLVLCNDFRHPVVTAKEAATIDVLSDGRFELGLGAGWMTTDYTRSGIPLDTAGTRIDRLEEAVGIIRALFGPEPVDVGGDHYRIKGLLGTPRPVQDGGPPLVIGGGAPKMLAMAGRQADIVGINPDLRSGAIGPEAGATGTAERTDEKLAWIQTAAGDRFADIELQVRIHLAMHSDDRAGVAALMAEALGLTPEEAQESPHALVGSTEEICDQLVERRSRWGLSYIGLSVDALDDFAPVIDRLAGT